eukprot:scaffold306848_cov36-Prasinocladus_malaysianus.AAC.1
MSRFAQPYHAAAFSYLSLFAKNLTASAHTQCAVEHQVGEFKLPWWFASQAALDNVMADA